MTAIWSGRKCTFKCKFSLRLGISRNFSLSIFFVFAARKAIATTKQWALLGWRDLRSQIHKVPKTKTKATKRFHAFLSPPCDRRVTHEISRFILVFFTFSLCQHRRFLLHLFCYLISFARFIAISKKVNSMNKQEASRRNVVWSGFERRRCRPSEEVRKVSVT